MKKAILLIIWLLFVWTTFWGRDKFSDYLNDIHENKYRNDKYDTRNYYIDDSDNESNYRYNSKNYKKNSSYKNDRYYDYDNDYNNSDNDRKNNYVYDYNRKNYYYDDEEEDKNTFSHYPMNMYKNKVYDNYSYKYISYEWISSKVYLKTNKLSLFDIEAILENEWNFKFFRYSYYWKNNLLNLKDSIIDFSYLDREKLTIPVVWFYKDWYMKYIIHKDLVSLENKKLIWDRYESNKLKIFKQDYLYIIKQKITKDYDTYYDYKKYMDLLEDLKNDYTLITLQIWENASDKYDLKNFDDDIIQIETLDDWTIKWTILEWDVNTYQIKNNDVEYWQDYSKDQEIADQMISLYVDVKKYYREMGQLPWDLWSMSPNFIDINSFNEFWHELFYRNIDQYCYIVWFKPKSYNFKNKFKSQINDRWFWYTNTCIK